MGCCFFGPEIIQCKGGQMFINLLNRPSSVQFKTGTSFSSPFKYLMEAHAKKYVLWGLLICVQGFRYEQNLVFDGCRGRALPSIRSSADPSVVLHGATIEPVVRNGGRV